MRTLGNILWHFPFCGFVSAIFTLLSGLILTCTVVGAPVGLGLMEYGKFLFAPYSHVMISKSKLNVQQNTFWKIYCVIVTILYLPFGILLCIIALFQIVGLCLSIFGIPVAVVLAKSLGTCLNPVNKKCVPKAVADELDRRKAQDYIAPYPTQAAPAAEPETGPGPAAILSPPAPPPQLQAQAAPPSAAPSAPTPRRFVCACGQGLSIPPELRGKLGRCPRCKRELRLGGPIEEHPRLPAVPTARCPSCRVLIKVPEGTNGKTGRCPNCHKKFIIRYEQPASSGVPG